MEILRYEIRHRDEFYWSECSRDAYNDIRRGAFGDYEVRAIGVVEDVAGLLTPGPDGFATWQDAATAERLRRVEAERNLKAVTEQPSEFLYRYRLFHDENTVHPGWDNWQWCTKEKFDEINYYIRTMNARYEAQALRATVDSQNTFNPDLPCPLPKELRPVD